VVTGSRRAAHRALMRLPLRLALAIGLLFPFIGSTPAFAATRIWTGLGANNLWTTPQNWQGNVAPVTGDDLAFPAGSQQTANVNNYPAGTLFKAIQFLATYNITGNRVLLELNIIVNGNGATVAFQCDITTGGNGASQLFIGIDDGAILLTTGVISGGTQVVMKGGPGPWNMSGALGNTYSGLTRVNDGTLLLNKPAGITAIPAGLMIGDGAGAAFSDIVRLLADRQITGPVTIQRSGWLDLNDHFDSFGALTMMGTSRITTGTGELALAADVEVHGVNASINGRVALGGPARVFTTHSSAQDTYALAINARISGVGGDGGVIKRGPGVLVLAGANQYGGFTRVEAGALWVSNPQALGVAAADAGTGVLADGRIALFDSIALEPLLLEKGSATEPALECLTGAGTVAWLGAIHLTGSTGVSTTSTCAMRLGPISGAGEFWTSGNVVELNNSNIYTGDTRVQSGTLRINASNRIPDSSTVRLGDGGLLSLNGFNEIIASLVGPFNSFVVLGNGLLTVTTPANTEATYGGTFIGSGSVMHNGPGKWILTGAHQHLGTTSVVAGTLQFDGSMVAASEMLIGGTGILTGMGTAAGSVTGVSGRFRPGRGDGAGMFSTGPLGLFANHTLDFFVRPGATSRIIAHGSVNLSLAKLELRKNGGVQVDTPLMLIDNDANDPVGGTFAGLPEGAFVTAGDQVFRITYTGGTGNDVMITPTELTYFLSEGSTGTFFDTDILIANPHNTTVPVTVEFLVEGGGQVITQEYLLPRQSRTTIAVDAIPGLESAAVSTKVRSTLAIPIVVERTMWWAGDARYGAHTEKATGGMADRWYFAEGSQGFFFTYLLLANPLAQNNEATVRFLLEGGGEVVKTYPLTPLSRRTVAAGDVPELVGQSFGIEVTFAHGGVAERAMYFGLEPLWTAGHESAGVPAPANTWFLAEGATGPFFETFILLANPNAAPADATVRFLPAGGVAAVVKQVQVPANGRVTINIEPQDESLANVPVATDVSSTLPIVVERAQYWPDPAPQWYEAHNSFGVTETAHRWGLAEGRVGDSAGYQTYVLLANPTANAASVTITFLRESGAPIVKQFTVEPASRLNVSIGSGDDVPELTNERFGALIESTVPIVVERALYANFGAQVWGAGTNATATRLP
jgi:autotransporter-associated beta strand protein